VAEEVRGEDESLTVEGEQPWKRLREKELEVANKVGEANLAFFYCFLVVCLMNETWKAWMSSVGEAEFAFCVVWSFTLFLLFILLIGAWGFNKYTWYILPIFHDLHVWLFSLHYEINSSTSSFLFTWMWCIVISFPLSSFWYHAYWCGWSTWFYISMRPKIDGTLACTSAIYFGAATFPFLYLVLRRYPFFYTAHVP